MTDIGIVGAGAAAAATAFRLDKHLSDANVTILEKSGGVCGRAATRRHEDVTYDYGANYVKSDDEQVVKLLTEALDTEGLVDVTEPIYTFDESGDVSPGRSADEHKWSYRSGLTQIAKRLFACTDATIHRRTRVDTLRRDGDTWTLVDTDGTSWGPFDAVVLNPPGPQTADLLRDAEWTADAREQLADAADLPYRTIWTAVLHYPFEIDVPYYALVNVDKNHDVGWFSREECKPGHVPDGESLLIAQANEGWSIDRYDEDPATNVAALADAAADVIGEERLRDPDWTDHQGWRYALPEDGAPEDPLRNAEEAGLYPTGDWITGEPRLHAALANGLNTGERMIDAVS